MNPDDELVAQENGLQLLREYGAKALAEAKEQKPELRAVQKRLPKQGISEGKGMAGRDRVKQVRPKMEKAVEEVVKEGNFDLVLERGAVVDVITQYDITRQVIERMNQQR